MASTLKSRRSPPGQIEPLETDSGMVRQRSRPSTGVYDPRLTSTFDNYTLPLALVYLLVALTLSTANFIVVVDAPQAYGVGEICDFSRTFIQLYLGSSLILFGTSVTVLLVIVFSIPGSNLTDYKIPAQYAWLTVVVLQYLIGAGYGTYVWWYPPSQVPINTCITLVSYKVLLIDVFASHILLGAPLALLGYVYSTKAGPFKTVAKIKQGKSVQVEKYVA